MCRVAWIPHSRVLINIHSTADCDDCLSTYLCFSHSTWSVHIILDWSSKTHTRVFVWLTCRLLGFLKDSLTGSVFVQTRCFPISQPTVSEHWRHLQALTAASRNSSAVLTSDGIDATLPPRWFCDASYTVWRVWIVDKWQTASCVFILVIRISL